MDPKVQLNINELAPRERHPMVFSTFDALDVNEYFTISVDHDPRPLYFQFLFERSGEFDWMNEKSGPDVWIIRIKRIRTSTGSGRPAEEMHCGCGKKSAGSGHESEC